MMPYLYAIPPLIAAIGNLAIGCLVLWKNPRNALHKAWTFFSLCCAVWSFGFFMVYINHGNKQAAFMWNHIYSIGMVMIPTAYLYYVLVLTELRKKWLWIFYGISVTLAALLITTIPTPLFNNDLVLNYWGYSPVRGIAGTVYDISYPIIVSIGTYSLFAALRISYGRKRIQITYGIIAAIVGFVFGFTNFLPLYGVTIYPVGHIGNLLANIIVAYSIIRYTFMDIDIIIKKGFVYSIASAALVGLYVSSIIVTQEFLHISRSGSLGSTFVTAIAIILIALVFEPLRNYLQKFVDKRFFKTHYDYQEAIKEFSRMVVTILDLDQLLHRTARTIKGTLQLDQAIVLLHNPEARAYEVAAFDGGDENVIAGLSFVEENELVGKLASEKARVFLDYGGETGNAVISLKINNELIGFLLLGEKLSGDVYTPADMDLLATLADQLSIAVENARLYRAAVTDKLSKLFNGAYFYDRLEDELARSKEQKSSLGIVMMDIDGFMEISVNEGTDVADYIISVVGKIIRGEVRQFDIAARVGDDEFAIILPGVKKDELRFWESKIAESVSRIKINGQDGLVTVSTGTAYVENGLKASRRLLNDAKRSLIQAKSRKTVNGLYS